MPCPFLNNRDDNDPSAAKQGINLEKKEIDLYVMHPYDKTLLPQKPNIYKDWWEKDTKTMNHAKFCLPLLMANGIGYDILSPVTFTVSWSGNEEEDAIVKIIEAAPHGHVDNHSAKGSFTVQPSIIPRTPKGCFTLIKGIPNIRRPFSVMEGLMETWWLPSHFGLVCLCNNAGEFLIQKGEPIARMIFLSDEYLKTELIVKDNQFEIYQRKEFEEKRRQQTGHVLDYFKGLFPNGEKTEHHFKPNEYK